MVSFLSKSGVLKDGFSFQAGAGGISLAVTKFIHDYMKLNGIVGDFVMGGVTGFVVDILLLRASALSTNRAPRLSSSNRLSLSSSSKVTSKVQHHHTSPVVILEWYGNGRVQIGFSGESKPRFSSFHFRPDSNDETSKEEVEKG